jgi:MoxR-like ATPase
LTAISPEDLAQRAGLFRIRLERLRQELGKVFFGHLPLVEDLLTTLVAGGHVLLEGVPGLGKTVLAKSLARCMGLQFSRVQFTPDLMPSDITGTSIFDEHEGRRTFRFERGPVFANLLLADEINRATPKTQSALLEAMQERAVTAAGVRHVLPEPFLVIATQNPIEMEGTYPLPEAQLDRFMMKLVIRFPQQDELDHILAGTTGLASEDLSVVLARDELLEMQGLARGVPLGEHLLRFTSHLLRLTHPESREATDETRRFVRYGASPRAGQAMILAAKVRALMGGRFAVSRDDLKRVVAPCLRHRVLLSFEAEAEGKTVEDLLPVWVKEADRAVP